MAVGDSFVERPWIAQVVPAPAEIPWNTVAVAKTSLAMASAGHGDGVIKRSIRSLQGILLGLMAPAFVLATLMPPLEFEPSISAASWQPPPYDPVVADAHWNADYASFERSDREHPTAPGGVVFVGSSSISAWPELERVAGSTNVVRRGFGGSLLADAARHVPTLVVPSKPRVVVVYAGDNDLAEGASPDDVLERYMQFVHAVHEALPATRIVFMSIKPSPVRLPMMEKVRTVNHLVEAQSHADSRLEFVDIFPLMLDARGKPRLDLFMPDMLHPSPAGYALWNTALAAHLR